MMMMMMMSMHMHAFPLRAPWRVHGSLRPPDRLRQRARGPAGAGPRPLLHAQRPAGPGGPAGQQLQVPGRGHTADVAVAPRGVAVRKQPGEAFCL